MQTRVARWGNSLALRIPKKLATSHQIFEDSRVEIVEREDGLLLRPNGREKYDLEGLLAGVTRENLHGEFATGEARGQEIW
jgi:antitoxin MazE